MERITEVHEVFLSLIRCGIFGYPVSGPIDWGVLAIYELAGKHDMAHLLAGAIRECGIEVDAELKGQLQKQKLTAIWRCERMGREQERILTALEEAKIDHMLIKGDMVRRHYPEPWMRTSCDIDVLVRREDLERAERVLAEGLRFKSEGKHYHDLSMRSESGVHLELHFSLNVHHGPADEKLASVWEKAVPVQGCSYRYEMPPTFFMYYFVAHMAGHVLRGGCGVRGVLDLYLLEQKLSYDADALYILLEETGLRKFYDEISYLGKVWFAGAEADPVSAEVGAFILGGGIYGTVESRITVAKGQSGGTVKYWYRRLFQSRELLQGTYPQLEKRPYLYPYYQVKRWFRFLRPDTRRRILREVRLEKELPEQQFVSAEELLSVLGLEKR